MAKKMIVRADDLGFSQGINYGIEKSVKEGIVRSVGVMPNMPDAAHGIRLLEGTGVCYGQHTNICAGVPLTAPERIPSLCQENGEFKASRTYRAAAKEGTDFVVLDEVILEIEAQYQRFVELTGDQPHYFEGHAVASANFFKGLEIVAQRHNLPYLPMSFDGPTVFKGKKLYMSCDSMFPNYDPRESLKKAALSEYPDDGISMFVGHPGYLDDYILRVSSLTVPRTQEVAAFTDPEIIHWLVENDIQIVTYDEV